MKSLRLEEIIDSNVIGLVKGTKDQSTSFEHPYIKMNNITNEGKLDVKGLVFVESSSDEVEKYTVTKGDLLFNTRNSAQLVGKSCIYDLDTDSLYNNNLMRLRFKDGVLGDFIQYQFYSKKVRAQIKKFTNSTTNVAAIYFKNLKSLELKIPPLEEQKKIAAILDAADAYRQKTKALIDKYDQLTQSLFLDMFGDPVTNPKGWEIASGKEFYEVRGRVGWKGYKKTDLRLSGAIVLGATHITKCGTIDLSKVVYLSDEKFLESPEIMIQNNDLIFVQRGNTIGKIGLIREDLRKATINPVVLILRPKAAHPLFLLHLILNKSLNRQLVNSNSGSAQPMITQKTMNEIQLIQVPLTIQNHFTERVAQIEKQKQQAEESLVKAEELFSSLLQRAFKGELTS